MPPEPSLPIAPELFDRVEEYSNVLAEMIARDDESTNAELSSDTSIVIFCENFFGQFFRNVLEARITGFGSAAKMRAVVKRRALPRSSATRRLIAAYEQLCDLWPDIQGRGYSVSASHRTEFHISFLPKLFKRITEWAKEAGYEELSDRAAAVADYYAAAVEGFPDG